MTDADKGENDGRLRCQVPGCEEAVSSVDTESVPNLVVCKAGHKVPLPPRLVPLKAP